MCLTVYKAHKHQIKMRNNTHTNFKTLIEIWAKLCPTTSVQNQHRTWKKMELSSFAKPTIMDTN